ncbi:MAG: hypothetical protein PWP70_1576 [Moorella sp. (in: firmicutes)]|nr:hypothetical protein [Moorella sp. (in: firmicutes)]
MEERTRLRAIRFPEDIIRDLNKYVGRSKQSEFITCATRKAFLQLKQDEALKKAGGIFGDMEYPEFHTPADTRAWVQRLRQEADERLKRICGDK